MLAAGIDDIDHPAYADIENEIGLAVEEFRAVDEGEVMDFVHVLRCLLDLGGVADIAGDEFDILRDLCEPARASTRIVVKHAHAVTGFDQRFDEARTDETAAAGDEDTAHARAPSFDGSEAMSIHFPCWCDRRAASMSNCTR